MAVVIRPYPSVWQGTGWQGSAFQGVGQTIAPNDTISISDGLSVQSILTQTPAETIVITDVAALFSATHAKGSGSHTGYQGMLTQGEGFQGAGTAGSIFTPVTSDNIQITDRATFNYILHKTATDSIAISDSAARIAVFVRTAVGTAGSGGLGGSGMGGSGLGGLTPAPGDVIFITDVASKTVAQTRSATDSISITDFAVKQMVDVIVITDAATVHAVLVRSATDSIPLADAAIGIQVISRPVADSITVTDSVTGTLVLARSATDSIPISEVLTDVVNKPRPVADAIVLTDAAGVSTSLSRSVTDVFIFTDFVKVTISRPAFDTISITDAVHYVLVLIPVPGIATLSVQATGFAAISVEPTAFATLGVEATGVAAINVVSTEAVLVS